jgi:SAM-dependent methyltransferase
MRREDWDERYAAAGLVWTAEPNRFLVAELADLPPRGRALDLACGEGRNAVWLAERGWEVTGVDFSGVALEKGARLAEARGVEVTWVEADLTEYVPERGAFGLVVQLYLHVVEGERRTILCRAAEALAPGGTLLVVGHDSSNLEHGYGGPRDARVLFTPADVVGDLADLDLASERADVVERPVETDEGPRVALDVLARLVARG